jgi:hypothetical protein
LGQHNRWSAKAAFGIDVRIVSGTNWLLDQAASRLRALRTITARYPTFVAGGAWRVCPQCYTRTKVPISRNVSGDLTSPDTRCEERHPLSEILIDLAKTIESPVGACPMFILPVHLDDIMERLLSDDFDLTISYPGSYTHLHESVNAIHVLHPLLDRSKRSLIPDWCPSHRTQNIFRDFVRGLPHDQQVPIASLLYRSSLTVACSIFPQDLRAAIGKHIESTLTVETIE